MTIEGPNVKTEYEPTEIYGKSDLTHLLHVSYSKQGY